VDHLPVKLLPLLLLASAAAHAADGDGIPQGTGSPGSGILVPMPALTRGMTLGPGTGGAAASFTRNPFNFPAPGGATASATMSGGINAAGAARALAIGLARGALIGGAAGVAATGAAMLWDYYRVVPDGTGGLVEDPGVATTSTQVPFWYPASLSSACSAVNNPGGSSKAGACSCYHTNWVLPNTHPDARGSISTSWYDNGTAEGSCRAFQAANSTYPFNDNLTKTTTQQQGCLQVVINGQSVTPQPGYDGKCPTGDGGPRAPITPEAAQAKVAANPPSTPPNYPALLTVAIDEWGPLSMRPQDIHNNQLNVISTPNSYAGPVTTATDILSGDTTTTETHYDFSGLTPTSMTYDPSRMSLTFTGSGAGFAGANSLGSTIPAAKAEWATRTVTTKRDAQGNITSQTTTTTASGTGTNTTTGEEAPATDCGTNPNRAGCLELGDAPLDAVVPASHALTWAAVNLGLPAACPAPYSFTFRGASYAVPYTKFCEHAPNVRLLLIALTSVAVAAFVLSSVK
jgi:hypothetical protein